MYDISFYLEQQNFLGDDNLFVSEQNGVIWFCLVDGAGGNGGGAEASSFIVSEFESYIKLQELNEPGEFEHLLRNIDKNLYLKARGVESTAVVGKVSEQVIMGASVGDCEVWLCNQEFDYELTSLQFSKPLVGSAKSIPVGFGPANVNQAVLIGSDGLFKYADLRDLLSSVRSNASAKDLSLLAKVSTGNLQDDISVICIRNR